MTETTLAHPPATRARRTPYWLIPTGLVLLSLVPIIAGASRITGLATGVEQTPDNARFVEMPLPVIIHIVGATIYCLLGAFQFHPGIRRSHPRYHRMAGRVLIPAGLAAAASGLWMTEFYELPAFDQGWLSVVRWVVGIGMFAGLIIAYRAVRRRDFATHRAWMIRSYAIGIAAGTQVFTSLPLLVIGEPTTLNRAITMTAGWAINLAVAEWIIRRRPTS